MDSQNVPTDPGLRTRSSRHAPRQWFTRAWVWITIVLVAAVAGFSWGRISGPETTDAGEALSALVQSEDSGEDRGSESTGGANSGVADHEDSTSGETGATGPLALTAAGYPTFQAEVFSGSGEETLDGLKISGPMALSFDCPACEGPVTLRTDLTDDANLVEVEGPFAGTFVAAAGGQVLNRVEVVGNGDWTLVIQDLDSLPKIAGYMDAMGTNSFIYTGEADRADVTHQGEGIFELRVYGLDESPLVMEEGAYEGSVPLARGVVSIRTLGQWSFLPEDQKE